MTGDPHATRARDLRARALNAVQADDLEKACELLERATREAPDDFASWTNYGSVLGELGRHHEARTALETACRLAPDAVEPASNLGVLDRETGNLEEAERRFRAILTRVPESLGARYNLAHTLFLAARFEDAADAYREGLRRDPDKTANQNARLAWALLAAGRGSEARRELRRSLERLRSEEYQAMRDEAFEVLSGLKAAQPHAVSDIAAVERLLSEALRAQAGTTSNKIRGEVPPEQ